MWKDKYQNNKKRQGQRQTENEAPKADKDRKFKNI